MRTARRIAAAGALATLAALSCGSAPVLAQWPRTPALQKEKPPADPAVIDLQGFRELLQKNRGKPLLVTFWATWCEPCREEYPGVNELARQYGPRGLVVIGISLDEDAEITLVRRFLARNKPVFANYRKHPGEEEAFIRAVHPRWTGEIPANFLFSADGRMVAGLIGEHTREEIEAAIQKALGSEPAPGPAKRSPGP